MKAQHKEELAEKLQPFLKSVRHGMVDAGLENYVIDEIKLRHISEGGFDIEPHACVADSGVIHGNCPSV